MTEAEHDAMLGAEIACVVREVTKDVTGGNCAFADSDVKLLGRLATLAITRGLHNELIDLSLYTRRNMDRVYGLGVFAASGTEARRAETENTGSVHDGPTAESGDAHD
jgi:hypothetical protein